MIYLGIVIVLLIVLFVPFIPLGGNYYRSLLLIYYKDYLDSGGGFINFFPDIPYLRIVQKANPIWFRYISGDYARDHRYVYVEGYHIEGSDPITFRSIASPFSIAKPFSEERYVEYYYADRNTVRKGSCLMMKVSRIGRAPENFDAETFRTLGGGYVRDKTGVYFFTSGSHKDLSEKLHGAKYERSIFLYEPVEIVDPETFHLTELSSLKCMAKDRNFVFNLRGFSYGSATKISRDGILEIVDVVEASDFQDLRCRYYRTDMGIFFSEKRLSDADEASFEVIAVSYNRHCYPYAKDKNLVYFMSRTLIEADPRTFQIVETSPYYSFDSKRRFSQGNDISSFSKPHAESENIQFEEAYRKWQAVGLKEGEQINAIKRHRRKFPERGSNRKEGDGQ